MKPGIEDFFRIGDAVAVGVLQIEDVGGGRGEDPLFPGENAGDLQQAVGENGRLVDLAVAIGVFKETNAAARLLALCGVEGVVQHFGNVDAAGFVEADFDGIDDMRLGGEEFRAEPVDQNELGAGLGRFRRVGVVRAFAAAGQRKRQSGQDHRANRAHRALHRF